MPIKITTWNVNGVRAALGKGLIEWVNSEVPDILCLQEIKARPDQVDSSRFTELGYTGFWNPAERPGYSGVAVFTRILPTEVKYGMGIERFDVEGRVIQMSFPEFDLFNIYFPNGQRGKERVEFKLEFYDSLLEQLIRLHKYGKNLIITGDFNTAHSEIDLANPAENSATSGFLLEERLMIDKYLKYDFVDIYRNLYPERIQYTWWTYRFAARIRNIGWRIDYFLASQNLVPKIKDVVIHDDTPGSDHCPVTLHF